MKPASRNLWLEFAALCLFLFSLVLFLLTMFSVATFFMSGLLPDEPSPVGVKVVVSIEEVLVAALSTFIPGLALVATAWGLRSLLADEKEPDA